MNNITNWLLAIIIVLLLGGGVYWIYTNQNPRYTNTNSNTTSDSSTTAATDTKDLPKLSMEINEADHKLGPDDAPVKLVEYADFQCPACKQLSPTFMSMADKFPGQVQFVYRHFPLSYHPLSKDAARIAEGAAEQGKFFEMAEYFFTTSDFTIDSAYEHAASLGLDIDKIKSDVAAGKYDAAIDKDYNSGQESGVAGTPTLYMNGTQLSWEDTTGLENTIKKALGE
ncbi:MAG TPA: thioredoxin domain-containing protein [bacterium]|nr:thioredoxin domain-containing protein [bacterium]